MITRKRKIGILLIACLLTVGVASVYAQNGKPLGGLNELWDTIFGVQEDVEDIQATLALHFEIADLRARVAALEDLPPGGGTPGPTGPKGDPGDTGPPGIMKPDYDSGWTPIDNWETIHFDPGFEITPNLFVYIIGRYDWNGHWIYTQQHLGGEMWKCNGERHDIGLFWYMSNDQIPPQGVYEEGLVVFREYYDIYWQEVRVMIWQLPPPPP